MKQFIAMLTVAALVAAPTSANADDDFYEVTVTNLTRGQSFTPILVATHRPGVALFEPGQPASPELAILAEGGDTA
ncbi:MAG: spondin domain-containing protein, partial [Gammaproteobacteria bacterium]|nr:spondin domain-containing protein [Gammaproteobacteria bacterium]